MIQQPWWCHPVHERLSPHAGYFVVFCEYGSLRDISKSKYVRFHSDCANYFDNLSPAMFLWNHYKQALDIIKETPQVIARAMADLGVSDVGVFKAWLEEEREYLQGLKKEPAEETLQMEYYQRLLNLWASE